MNIINIIRKIYRTIKPSPVYIDENKHIIAQYIPKNPVIVEAGTCDDLCGEWSGEYPADEAIPLPPYHTNCQCSAYYIETDDEDDVNDLDLEVEEIKNI